MTKAELIAAVAKSAHQPKKLTAQIIESAFGQIERSIRKEKRFWMPGFGTFTVRKRKTRAGFNPRTNAPMTIPAARTIGFRPAPELRKGL
ncbi:MAG TPA: HU family DNA-binding protein [Candidatus Binataceae bacterium]|nr:HU family DNA-binding protein [Candidatus Binataceae bacterium]